MASGLLNVYININVSSRTSDQQHSVSDNTNMNHHLATAINMLHSQLEQVAQYYLCYQLPTQS